MRKNDFERELVNQLKVCKDVIKKLIEDNKVLQIRVDTLDLLSCFMFAKVPDAKSQGYGTDPIYMIDRLVEQYEMMEEHKRIKRENKNKNVTEYTNTGKIKKAKVK